MAVHLKELPMPVKVAADHLRRITGARGWRSGIVFLFTCLCGSALIFYMMAPPPPFVTPDQPVHGYPTQTPSFREGSSSPALNAILRDILSPAASDFHPDAKDATDLDIAHIARQTAVLKDLFTIYATVHLSDDEKENFRRTITHMQRALYPWITQLKDGGRGYDSLFDMINSYKEDAGIVISAGKDGGFRWAIHQIVTLRAALNCSLPIEVFYGGDNDLPEVYRHFIRSIELAFPGLGSITTVDITQKFRDPDNILGLPGGWAMRPFSILASSFKTAILADADTIFLQDPRVLLQEYTFLQYGSLFWHDRLLRPAPDETYKWVDEVLENVKAKHMEDVHDAGWFRHQTYYEMESGVVVVDKTRNLAGVLMTCHMNSQKVRDQITYRRFYGDKESYWFSHALTSTPYHFVPGYSGGIGRITHPNENDKENLEKEHICTLQLLHVLESTGEPLWFNNAITEYKGANDAHYLVAEGWIPHDGRWSGGGTRFPNEFCVSMPEGDRDRQLGLPAPVHRVDGVLKLRIDRAIEEIRKYDSMMEHEGLVHISTS